MKNDKKLFKVIIAIIAVILIAMIANITLNLRDFAFNNANSKADLVAQSVKNGLTAHMVNNIMDNRDFYLEQTRDMENIEDIWLVRSKVIEEQYGEGFSPKKDAIDEKVLRTGKEEVVISENFFGHSTYRITIPYKAEINNHISCLDCHQAKVGDTLGVISMVMTLDDVKLSSIKIIVFTSIISILLIVIILLLIRYLIMPYLRIFSSIKEVMKSAHEGDYSGRIEGITTGEASNVAYWINEHMKKLQGSLSAIVAHIDVFLSAHKYEEEKDPVVDVQNTVARLADVYKFRKTIEHDESIEEVYNRFAVILEDRFDFHNFSFIEADTTNKNTEVVYTHKELECDPLSKGCRADRTNTTIDSCQFKVVCSSFHEHDNKFYVCVPYSISNDLDFIISIVADTKEEHQKAKHLLPFIKEYIDAAKPEIVSKKLMQLLKRNAQTDPLTGLYNRKFLEEFIQNVIYKGKLKDTPCGVMMVDIDFFKQINDNYGHDIGDIAIKTISNTLTDIVSEEDIVIRFGGEEFIVILANCNEEQLLEVAERIRVVFSQQKIQAGSETFSKTVSLGVTMFPNKQHDFWKYVKQSDIALYKAKESGRNKVCRFDDNTTDTAY